MSKTMDTEVVKPFEWDEIPKTHKINKYKYKQQNNGNPGGRAIRVGRNSDWVFSRRILQQVGLGKHGQAVCLLYNKVCLERTIFV